ncbi:MAG: long chain acyl-CoA synthetase [Myxococcaceae bacterium]|nr:long chain acyl-CoA synthetase [Myxococcaceae bacterium]
MNSAIPQLHDYLHDAARRAPHKVALVVEDARVTYRELEARSNALANTLVSHGVQRGDRVVVFAENGVEAVVAFWAALKANAVACVINPLTRQDKLAYCLQDCRAAALITDAHLAPAFVPAAARSKWLRAIVCVGPFDPHQTRGLPVIGWEEALADGDPEAPPPRRGLDVDLAAIIYTSGSTGEPKGVMLTHRNMLTAATSISTLLELNGDDVILSVLPLAFNYGLYQMILSVRMGARLVLERSFSFPVTVLEKAVEEQVTGFPGVPTLFSILAELKTLDHYDLSSVRFVTNTADVLTTRHVQLLERLFPRARIYSMYGLTECKRCSCLPPEDLKRKPGSVGFAIPNTELWLVDEHDRRLGPGMVGELVISGATVMLGYWDKPDETAKRLRPGPLPGQQVLYTGDLCRLDDEGYLYFVARMDDIIKSRGEKVAPKEVETALMNVPGVREAAVIGAPDALLGTAVKAFVVLEAGVGLTEKQLQHECKKRIESFMVPRQIVFVPELPKTTTGKIKKTELR